MTPCHDGSLRTGVSLIRDFAVGALALIVAAVGPGVAQATSTPSTQESRNASLIADSFDKWTRGEGSMFDLLSDDANWEVAGVSPVSNVYESKRALVEQAVQPIHAQLLGSITPRVRHIVAQGDQVVVIWDGVATAKDGTSYENTYAWYLTMANGQVTGVLAFLDTWNLDRLMRKP
ncbi:MULTISPECIES: nuclear transport factor 2 family protein [unclassified Bordetella]|uniref:nuclear transport factor 2 family protein n=1 Tax=unclassified Bordetella TaxID=2630031 RepID=UPI00132A8440|nr:MULTISPECIES: nuclear transport factor 2 family protein [unclassified Bordetella]MVW72546.1 nuclear transport factor 2 family protein [Bordetella sp. 15P40C-2]MVW79057.1 nuclear transport factor 2 family protein [Bordetella sp. 02P26C-1]